MLPNIKNRVGLFFARRIADFLVAVLLVLSLKFMYWGLLIVIPTVYIYIKLISKYSYDESIKIRVLVVFIGTYFVLLLIRAIPGGGNMQYSDVLIGILLYITICVILGRVIIPLPYFFVFRKFDQGEADTAFFTFCEICFLAVMIFAAAQIFKTRYYYGGLDFLFMNH